MAKPKKIKVVTHRVIPIEVDGKRFRVPPNSVIKITEADYKRFSAARKPYVIKADADEPLTVFGKAEGVPKEATPKLKPEPVVSNPEPVKTEGE